MKNKGLSLLPVILGIVVSVIVIGLTLVIVTKKLSDTKRENRLAATHLSDLGFQDAMANLDGLEGMVSEKFRSIPKNVIGSGSYEVIVNKEFLGDTLLVSVNSTGVVGGEDVVQLKKFRLVRNVVEQDTVWGAAQ